MIDMHKDFLYSEIKDLEKSVKEVSEQISAVDKKVAEYSVAFEHHTAVDEQMYQEFKRMNDILAMNTESLKEHIRRTNAIEEILPKFAERLTQLEVRHIEEQAIDKFKKERIWLIVKVLTGVGSLIGILMAMKPMIIALINK